MSHSESPNGTTIVTWYVRVCFLYHPLLAFYDMYISIYISTCMGFCSHFPFWCKNTMYVNTCSYAYAISYGCIDKGTSWVQRRQLDGAWEVDGLVISCLGCARPELPGGERVASHGGIWGFPEMRLPLNGWFIRENPIKMDDLVVPPILGNIHMVGYGGYTQRTGSLYRE